MMSVNKNIVIWGAGKIGRGFIGDIFDEAGYDIHFVDANAGFIDALKRQGSYTVHHVKSEDQKRTRVIKDFSLYHLDDGEQIQETLLGTDLLALVVFPQVFDAVAQNVAEHIERRMTEKTARPLDILLCTNINHPVAIFRDRLNTYLSDAGKQYLEDSIGLVETLVIRMAVPPTKAMLEDDPFAVMTNGYETLTADSLAFRNDPPRIDGMRYTENIGAEEVRKLYTYNMVHAVYAYTGNRKGYTTIMEAVEDEDVGCIADGALAEISRALQKAYGFSAEEMLRWVDEVKSNMANPILGDTITRVGMDPKRKLALHDRLVGAAGLCRVNGVFPHYLATAIACGYLFDNPEDASSVEIRDFLQVYSIKEAVRRYSGLAKERELMQLISERYEAIEEHGISGMRDNREKICLLRRAYESGFHNELTIRGCAQCTIKTLGEVTGNIQSLLFKAASGYSGGIAITGDGSCGGYTGGVLYMGSYVGRRLEELEKDGDKVCQYQSFEMAQRLHDKFIETYGNVTCARIHEQIFDKAYCLRTKAVRNEFEEAGAHRDKCTSVIAMASLWTTEILLAYRLIELS